MKIHQSSRCPRCGRMESSERILRNFIERLIFPNSKRMKCRLCLDSFLVSTKSEPHTHPVSRSADTPLHQTFQWDKTDSSTGLKA